MLSQSEINSSAAQARFRVQAPNSLPRAVKVIALDPRSEAVVRRLAAGQWNRAKFFIAHEAAVTPGGVPRGLDEDLLDLDGHSTAIEDEIEGADLVVMVVSAGADAKLAAGIGRAASQRRVMTTALITDTATSSDAALARTLAQIRPWSLMVVMADDDHYIDDMMTALRA